MSRGAWGPLAGVRVVDWTQFGVGPFATSLLGAMGADVIHVEVPPKGDPQQYYTPTINGISCLYINFNTSKRSIHLDLRADADRERMWELIESADVLVCNLRASSVARLGFYASAVLDRNPRIIYCTSNGYGDGGPMADRTGADSPLQAFGGWCSIMGREGGEKEFLRFRGQLDLNTSLYIAAAVLTGLTARERSGGQALTVSMLEATLAVQATRLAEYLGGGATPGPLGAASAVVAPSQAFECQDKSYIAVSAETESQWKRLCIALGRPDLIDEPLFTNNAMRVVNRHNLAETLGEAFLTKPTLWWMQVLSRNLVPCSICWDFPLISVHPQVRENNHIIELDAGRFGTVYTGGPPWKFEHAPARLYRNPESGEHTVEVLDELAALRAQHLDDNKRTRGSDLEGLPFSGLRVLELATGITGPYCGALLADQGADVLKIEPDEGDRLKFWGPPFVEGVGSAFIELNRNKRISSCIGGEELRNVALQADIVIADAVDPDGNPPVLDLIELRKQAPAVIVCSISPYGERGPLADQPGSELTVQMMCNIWAGLGEIGGPPQRVGADQAHMNAGVIAYQGIVATLFRRAQTGVGDRVEVSALGALHVIKGMHWTSLSHPDQWPGFHLSVWTDPPDHGIGTKDRPILLQLSRGLGQPATPEQVEAIIETFGGQYPDGLDASARAGELSHPAHHRWRPFWTDLFKDAPWEEVARVVEAHGGEVMPFMDYVAFESDAQIAHLQPFVPLEGGSHRVIRLPWRRVGPSDDAQRCLPRMRYRQPEFRTQPAWRAPKHLSQEAARALARHPIA